jgi:hypothetical protein
MEAKDITKGKTEIIELQHKYKIGKRFSIEIDGIPTIEVKTAIGFHSDEEVKANAELICEAFNVANETGLSPRQMKERIKELEELLTESRNHFLYEIDIESGEPLADLSTLINFWGKVNNALNPKTEN